MRISAQAFHSPKAGNQDLEYEDAFCPEQPLISCKKDVFRFAVGDGATETSFSGVWAKQIVRAICAGQFEGELLHQTLGRLRERWHKIVSRKPMPWYAEEKLRMGAYAALVGLVLNDPSSRLEDGEWTALAIGDSCVFQIRGKKLVASFPMERSESFNNSPELLCSENVLGQPPEPALLTSRGTWLKGDAFYLMTDAIACWFLRQVENGCLPSRELQDLSSGKSKQFNSWLAGLRDQRAVRNDDVTILRVEIEKA